MSPGNFDVKYKIIIRNMIKHVCYDVSQHYYNNL